MSEVEAQTQRRALAEKVGKALNARQTWSKKVTTYYDMRRDGLRRQNKPYPGAADLHDAIIDDVITGKHPFYAGQLFGAERIASFSPVEDIGLPAQAEVANKLSEWFDDCLKQGTTLFQEALIANDAMMQSGRGILMVYWDAADERICFKSIDPQHFVVPLLTEDLQKAHWLARVVVLSCEDYEAGPYDQNVLPLVKGAGADGMETLARSVRNLREGITHGSADEVVLWEIYCKERNKITGETTVKVTTLSPVSPDTVVRADYTMPLWHEVRTNDAKVTLYPFVDLPNEVVESGWYSSRGDAEKLAAFEAWACKMWNNKADHLDYSAKPAFSGAREKNLANLKFVPGQMFDQEVKVLSMPAPPFTLDDERNRTRAMAEQRAKLPDFGIGGRNGGKSNKTATEVEAIQQYASNGVEMFANVYRMRLTTLLALTWAILIQKETAKLFKILGRAVQPEQLVRAFRVAVAGSVDSWNKNVQQQRALLLWNTFKGDPQINQTELRKLVLEGLDARLVKRLMIDPKIRGSDEQEDEAMEIVLMLNGFPAMPMSGEDHAGRAVMITQKMQAEAIKAAEEEDGTPEEPAEKAEMARAVQLLTQHREVHLGMLKQEQPEKFEPTVQAIKRLELETAAILQQIAAKKAAQRLPALMPQPAPLAPVA